MSATATLARWAAGTAHDWPADCVEQARRAFLDTVACMLAGRDEPAAARVRAAVAPFGDGEATVIGTALRLPAPWAALANGTAAHAQDYDDVNNPAMSHPSAALVPALLALGEELDASGAACLDAYLVGYEAETRLGEAMNLAHYYRGWHTTLSLGAPAVALACGRLMGLDADGLAAAFALATSSGGGSKRQFGTMAKPLHAGLAAKAGVLSARLAQAGVDAAPEILEGRWGMLEMMAGPEATGFDEAFARLGDPPAMREHGVWFKLYPCCASTHRPIDAALALRAREGVRPAAIAAVEAMVSANAAANLRYRIPATPSEARFSLPWCVAIALVDGAVGPASFEPAALARAEVRALAERVEMTVDPELGGDRPVTEIVERGSVTLTLGDDRRLHEAVTVPRGHPGSPLDGAALDDKLRACAAGALAPDALDAVLGALRSLGDATPIRALTEPLRVARGGRS